MLVAVTTAQADIAVSPSTEYRERIKVAQTVQPLGETPFGENINLYKGGLSFRQTDISLPGTGPTITLARSYELGGMESRPVGAYEMADWALSIPRIQTILPGDRFSDSGQWLVGSDSDARCGQFGRVSVTPYSPLGQVWWHGYQLVTPEGGSQPLLSRTAENTLAPDSGTYNIVTASNWMIGCIGQTASGISGDAFVALAPDGTKYTFDELVYGPAIETLTMTQGGALLPLPDSGGNNGNGNGGGGSNGGGGNNSGQGNGSGGGNSGQGQGNGSTTDPSVNAAGDTAYLPRKMGYMYATRIEDRFGNWIQYHYTNGRPTSITASDGREVSIVWRTDLQVVVVDKIIVQPSDGAAQTWQYGYTTNSIGTVLSKVTPPDGNAWQFDMQFADRLESTYYADSPTPWSVCGVRKAGDRTSRLTITMTHPSGLIGKFEIGEVGMGRSAVPTTCISQGGVMVESTPTVYVAMSLLNKIFTGPGIAPQTWNYVYSAGVGSSDTECAAAACQDYSWVDVTDPTQAVTRFVYSTRWGVTEGKLLSVVAGVTNPGQATAVGLSLQTQGYASPTAGPYPARFGDALDAFGVTNNAPTEQMAPLQDSAIQRQGVTFRRHNDSFDAYGNPLSVTRSSSGNAGGDRTQTQTLAYRHDTGKWVLSLPTTVTDAGTGTIMSETRYDAASNLPTAILKFGALQRNLGYDPQGNLTSVTDGNNHAITLGSWYRGLPQSIGLPTGKSQSATVNALGWLLSSTDENAYKTAYQYDAMGRLSRIDYPTGDAVAWNPLLRGFAPASGNDYGLANGHWSQSVTIGDQETITYYDARWQPVLVRTRDINDSSSISFVVNRFDGNGRQVFTSYPVKTLTNVDQSLRGTTTIYDALGRVTQVKQDSELGVLTTNTDYLAGFKTRVTNPRGKATTTSYQVFDQPDTGAPVKIEAPDGVTTTITRDVYGKPLSVTRTGPGS